MKFLKSYKYPLSISLSLIAVFFIFQNGTCNQTSSGLATTSASTTGNNSVNASSLILTASATTVAAGGTVTFTASGGTAPYYFYSLSGGGTFASVNSGVFTAPSSATSVIVGVEDSAGAAAQTASLTVTGSSSTLTLTPSAYTVAQGGTVTFTASGGTAPYSYYSLNSYGTFSNSTNGVFTAGATAGSAEVEVVDALSRTQTTTITVSANTSTPPTTPLGTSAFNITVDHYFAMSYSFPTGASYPVLSIFGTGPTLIAGWNCSPLVATAPCVQNLPLSNFSTSITNFSYRGIVTTSGRGGASSIEYCISPADTTKAYIKVLSGSFSLSFVNQQFIATGSGLTLFSGAVATTGLIPIDGPQGNAANYSTNVTGQYSVHTNCSDIGNNYIQVLPW